MYLDADVRAVFDQHHYAISVIVDPVNIGESVVYRVHLDDSDLASRFASQIIGMMTADGARPVGEVTGVETTGSYDLDLTVLRLNT